MTIPDTTAVQMVETINQTLFVSGMFVGFMIVLMFGMVFMQFSSMRRREMQDPQYGVYPVGPTRQEIHARNLKMAEMRAQYQTKPKTRKKHNVTYKDNVIYLDDARMARNKNTTNPTGKSIS